MHLRSSIWLNRRKFCETIFQPALSFCDVAASYFMNCIKNLMQVIHVDWQNTVLKNNVTKIELTCHYEKNHLRSFHNGYFFFVTNTKFMFLVFSYFSPYNSDCVHCSKLSGPRSFWTIIYYALCIAYFDYFLKFYYSYSMSTVEFIIR